MFLHVLKPGSRETLAAGCGLLQGSRPWGAGLVTRGVVVLIPLKPQAFPMAPQPGPEREIRLPNILIAPGSWFHWYKRCCSVPAPASPYLRGQTNLGREGKPGVPCRSLKLRQQTDLVQRLKSRVAFLSPKCSHIEGHPLTGGLPGALYLFSPDTTLVAPSYLIHTHSSGGSPRFGGAGNGGLEQQEKASPSSLAAG